MFWTRRLRVSHRAVSSLYMLLLSGLVCTLLVYALLWEAGNIAVSGCKKIGFYNYCLANSTGAGCNCVTELKDLHKEGVAFPKGLLVPVILMYSSLVIFLMGTLTLGFYLCFNERVIWMFALFCNTLSLMGISMGLLVYMSLSMVLIDLSELSSGFLALLLAILGLALLSFIIRHHGNQTHEILKTTKGDHEYQIYTLIT